MVRVTNPVTPGEGTTLHDGGSSATSSGGYTIVVSVALGCGTNVVRGASYCVTGDAVEASVSDVVCDPAAPSVWAMGRVGTPLPGGVRLVSRTIPAVANRCFCPYALRGLRHSRGVSYWLRGPYRPSSFGLFYRKIP
jgi:hypothetical protein